MNDNKAAAAYHPNQGPSPQSTPASWGLGGELMNLCICLPRGHAKATPVLRLHEIAVIDPHCKHHGDTK